VLGLILFLFALRPLIFRGRDWRESVGLDEQKS